MYATKVWVWFFDGEPWGAGETVVQAQDMARALAYKVSKEKLGDAEPVIIRGNPVYVSLQAESKKGLEEAKAHFLKVNKEIIDD